VQPEAANTPAREGQTTLGPEASKPPTSSAESSEVTLPPVSTTPVQAPVLTQEDPSLPRARVVPLPVGIGIILLVFVWLLWVVQREATKSYKD
jgi:hypothetical protein